MTYTLTALDATFLELEDHSEGALMNVGGVMIFDPPLDGCPTLEQIGTLVRSRLESLPRYRQRLSSEHPGSWSWPRWTDDDAFQVDNHISQATLPAPGGEVELCDWIATFSSSRMDRSRPLWELVLLEGLEGGRWAVAHRVHHAFVDGLGPTGVPELILDGHPILDDLGDLADAPGVTSEDGADSDPLSNGAGADPRRRSMLRRPPDQLLQATRAGAHALSSALRATLRPQETLSRSRMLVELIFEDEIQGAPRTSLNVAIGPSRRYAYVSCPLVDLKTIGDELGGSIHDAALAACTGGLRRLLTERGERLPDGGLRAMVPINLSDAAATLSLGGRLGSLYVELPVAEPVAPVRYRQIVESTRRLKASHAGDAAGTLVDMAGLAPPLVHASLARLLYGTRLFNLTITNVLGVAEPRSAFGAPLREIHPIVPLAADHAVGIAIASHDGLVTFGISADRASMPDLDVLADGIEEGIEDLLASASRGRRPRRNHRAPDQIT
ncbi:MAG: wax ester/triacylglycerol synthase family O-acyltransferase [Solirubrobacteraceae bacterium]